MAKTPTEIKAKIAKKMGGRRSPVKPATEMDRKLSVKHLKDSVKYHTDHMKEHRKAIEEDRRLIGERNSKKYPKI